MRSWSLPFFIHRGRTKFLVAPVIAAVFVAIWSREALTGCSLAFTWQAVLDAGLPSAAKKSKSREIKINVDLLEFEPRICLQILQAYVAGRETSI